MKENFGDFIQRKRLENKKTLRGFATEIKIAAPYLSDIENNNRKAPEGEVLEKIINALNLTNEEKTYAYDLVSLEKGNIAQDIPNYIRTEECIARALRTARDNNANVEDWEKFIKEMQNKKKE